MDANGMLPWQLAESLLLTGHALAVGTSVPRYLPASPASRHRFAGGYWGGTVGELVFLAEPNASVRLSVVPPPPPYSSSLSTPAFTLIA